MTITYGSLSEPDKCNNFIAVFTATFLLVQFRFCALGVVLTLTFHYAYIFFYLILLNRYKKRSFSEN
ncbi:hypothetical protein SAMN05421863_106218 [Nitrosomonas communis]|uniref:Uncharacterized protein n=1 Tax=Nitrosomonas communis TaxID=44574 RepID=A0A1I4UB83_9PROT|nr:hypothetical protein SAMN05421863_106218 [Nitrosomonas communis]